MQSYAISCSLAQRRALSCTLVHSRAIPCDLVQYRAISCNLVQSRISYNLAQSHTISRCLVRSRAISSHLTPSRAISRNLVWSRTTSRNLVQSCVVWSPSRSLCTAKKDTRSRGGNLAPVYLCILRMLGWMNRRGTCSFILSDVVRNAGPSLSSCLRSLLSASLLAAHACAPTPSCLSTAESRLVPSRLLLAYRPPALPMSAWACISFACCSSMAVSQPVPLQAAPNARLLLIAPPCLVPAPSPRLVARVVAAVVLVPYRLGCLSSASLDYYDSCRIALLHRTTA